MSTPAICWNRAPDRCEAEPTPEEPNETLPGFCLAWAINSAVVFAGTDGLATRM